MGDAFLTGFPGFLGSALLGRLLDRIDGRVHCLVQPAYRDRAEARADAIAADPDRVALHAGDITDPDLGLDTPAFRGALREVYHLAAVYDLGVERGLAERVNVAGTEHVLRFAAACPRLDRLHYVSTCYVSGRHPGTFGPGDLEVGQSFNNHYEATKHAAERAVRDRMAEGLPTTVYRPAITVGDSTTGATQKYDGPYQVLRWLLAQPRIAVLPTVRRSERTEVNVVPRDFVIDAIAALSARADTVDTVYQLCDPHPPSVPELLELFGAATGRRVLTPRVPKPALKAVLRTGLGARTGIDPALVDYFDHPTSYVRPNTDRALRDADVACPPIGAYVDRLVGYLRERPDADVGALT